uniref:Uncharacterized protein n=1 Tax=Romanomermis culicivorax TaxID=13658 RepID=A0A915JZ77_ROMCU
MRRRVPGPRRVYSIAFLTYRMESLWVRPSPANEPRPFPGRENNTPVGRLCILIDKNDTEEKTRREFPRGKRRLFVIFCRFVVYIFVKPAHLSMIYSENSICFPLRFNILRMIKIDPVYANCCKVMGICGILDLTYIICKMIGEIHLI